VPIKELAPKNAHAHGPQELTAWNKRRLKLKNDVLRECWLFGILSGLRRNNLRGLRWDMWDRERNALWMIQKGKKPLLLVLSQPMTECLERAKEAGARLHREQAQDWVFPSGQSRSGHVTVLGGGLDSPHALRRSYSSAALNTPGVSREDVDRLIGHSKAADFRTLAPYDVDRARIEYFREKQELISAHIMSLLEGQN
jgi:integrase